MITLLLAAAAAAEPVPDLSRDPDMRCFLAVAYAAGNLQDQSKADAEMQAGLAAVTMYYVGKLDGRYPGLDLKREVPSIIQRPSFQRELPAEMQRCGKEAQDRGASLQDFGTYLQGIAPLLNARPG